MLVSAYFISITGFFVSIWFQYMQLFTATNQFRCFLYTFFFSFCLFSSSFSARKAHQYSLLSLAFLFVFIIIKFDYHSLPCSYPQPLALPLQHSSLPPPIREQPICSMYCAPNKIVVESAFVMFAIKSILGFWICQSQNRLMVSIQSKSHHIAIGYFQSKYVYCIQITLYWFRLKPFG